MKQLEANTEIAKIAAVAATRTYSGVGADTPYFTRDVLAQASRFADASHKKLSDKAWNTLAKRFPTVFAPVADGATLAGDIATKCLMVEEKFTARRNERKRN